MWTDHELAEVSASWRVSAAVPLVIQNRAREGRTIRLVSNDPAQRATPGWYRSALCAQTDPEAFFPEKGQSGKEAKRICGRCEVRTACRDYALAHSGLYGIWGGLTESERRHLRATGTPAAPRATPTAA